MSGAILSKLTPASSWKAEKLDRGAMDVESALIAGALPRDKTQRLILMAAYMGDDAAQRQASDIIHRAIATRLHKHAPPGCDILKALAYLGIYEVTRPQLCVRCKGRGFHTSKPDSESRLDCEMCHGYGIKHMHGDDLYRAIQWFPGDEFRNLSDITLATWRHVWRSRYDIHVYKPCVSLHNQGVATLMQQLE